MAPPSCAPTQQHSSGEGLSKVQILKRTARRVRFSRSRFIDDEAVDNDNEEGGEQATRDDDWLVHSDEEEEEDSCASEESEGDASDDVTE